MIDQDQANREIFDFDFVVGGKDFGNWLTEFISTRNGYPFLMGGAEQYDLGDLLRALLPPAKRATELIERAFQRALAASAHSFDLDALTVLSHAAARSGFNVVTHDLSNAIETVTLKLANANWTEPEKAGAYLAVDAIIASLATFAYEGDKSALRVSKVLFAQPVLAPFSSALFTPLVLEDIRRWPHLWSHLLMQAGRPDELFGHDPESKWAIAFNEKFKLRSAHFDVVHVFVDLITSAIVKGVELEEIYNAAFADNLTDQVKGHAQAILLHLNDAGVIIRRRGEEDEQDELYINPAMIDLDPAEDPIQVGWSATVDPSPVRDWTPVPGRTPHELEQFLIVVAPNPTRHGLG